MLALLQAPTLPTPSTADSLHRVLERVFAGPEYEWVERRRMVSWLARLWQQLQDWLDHTSKTYPTAFNIVLVVLVVVLVALLVHIGYVMWRIVRPAARTGPPASAAGLGGGVLDARGHLALADELAAQGRYAEAIAHDFVAALLELDKRKALRFHVSKTPAEYVGEARLDDVGRAALAGLVAQLYRHLFGAVPCDETEYRSFGEAALELARGHHVAPA